MGKFTVINRLSKKETNELFIRFVSAIGALRNSVEAANFVKDLLSEQEAIMLARRLQIADLLIQEFTYEQIKKVMRVSDGTVARVQTWLKLYGEGYRMVVERLRKKTGNHEYGPVSWRGLKRRYPMYYWPQLLLAEIIKSANARERRRLEQVAAKLKEKNKIARQLADIFKARHFLK
jgi:TrpR-related protein YerC/YecD